MEHDHNAEQNLWGAMLRGDKRSFNAIHDLYFAHLLTYAARFTPDRQVVEECIQDLFVKLWMNRERLSIPASVKGYLFKAFRNTLYNKLNRRTKEYQIGTLQDFKGFELAIPAISSADEETVIRVKKFLNSLTDRQREAIYLFYFEGLTYQEVADILQLQLGGVYKLIYRALDNMRAHKEIAGLLLSVYLESVYMK